MKSGNYIQISGILFFILYVIFFFWAMQFSIHPEKGLKGSYLGQLPIFELMACVGGLILMGQFQYFKTVGFKMKIMLKFTSLLNLFWALVASLLFAAGLFATFKLKML